MTWVRLEPGFPRHPKTLGIGPLGRELFVAALCRCNEYLTDGAISLDELRRLTHYDGLYWNSPRILPGMYEPVAVDDVIESLISAELMSRQNGGLLIHDYEDFQPTKQQVLEQRALWREQKRSQRKVPGVSDIKSTFVAGTSSWGSQGSLRETKADVGARQLLPYRWPCPTCGQRFGTEDRRDAHYERCSHPDNGVHA